MMAAALNQREVPIGVPLALGHGGARIVHFVGILFRIAARGERDRPYKYNIPIESLINS